MALDEPGWGTLAGPAQVEIINGGQMTYPKTKRSRLKRLPDRGRYDRAAVHAVLDAGQICQVGICVDGQPFVIPTLYARIGEQILLHGARASRLLKVVQAGGPVCISVTLLDGLVLARSVFHHSMNYRSVVAFGRGWEVEQKKEKLAALKAVSDRLLPGRWEDARPPTDKELNATTVVAVQIEEASAKVRTGPPGDDEADYDLPVWAGQLPILWQWGTPQADPRLRAGIPMPDYLTHRPQKQ
jgi:nitroimidazol reductase NimA-like FMN-containing flavoprotein (pyridoxamine 5'-phosphate oxidase superfamily)